MADSIFSKLIKGEIPSHKIYEDETSFAFLDIHPIQPGHTLIVSKKQVEFLWDLDGETYGALLLSAKKVALHLREVLKVPYVGVKVVGTDVPHVHIHLIPFSTTEEFNNAPNLAAEPDHVLLAEIASKLAF